MGYVGHVWLGRYYSKIIETAAQLVNTFRSITENPVIAGLAKNTLDYELNGIWFLTHKNYSILDEPDGTLAHIVKQYQRH